MKKSIKIVFALIVLVPFFANAGGNLKKIGTKYEGKKIAIISVSANNYSNSLQGWNSADTSELMASRLNNMLTLAEEKFSDKWSVVAAASFITKPEYQNLAGEQREVGLPVIDGKSMPLTTKALGMNTH